MSKRRRFSNEFKQEAVRLTEEPGVSCAQVARELGITRAATKESRKAFDSVVQVVKSRGEERARQLRALDDKVRDGFQRLDLVVTDFDFKTLDAFEAQTKDPEG